MLVAGVYHRSSESLGLLPGPGAAVDRLYRMSDDPERTRLCSDADCGRDTKFSYPVTSMGRSSRIVAWCMRIMCIRVLPWEAER